MVHSYNVDQLIWLIIWLPQSHTIHWPGFLVGLLMPALETGAFEVPVTWVHDHFVLFPFLLVAHEYASSALQKCCRN